VEIQKGIEKMPNEKDLGKHPPLSDGIWLSDGEEVFEVPRKLADAILKAVPQLRYSFEHLGGVHIGKASKRKLDFSGIPGHVEHSR
jgi:hypothetical protein